MNYFDIDAVSATLLKEVVKKSPIHAEQRMETFEATQAMKLGTAFHAAVLELESFDELVAVSPSVDRRTKAGKEEYATFLEGVGDRTVITHEQGGLVGAMQDAVLKHPKVEVLMDLCHHYEFQTEFTVENINCKAKIDMVNSEGTIVDFKTTQDASPKAFIRQSANLLYHLQMAWYAKAMGLEWNEVNAYIVAVENTPPHGVAVYKLSEVALLNGWELCKLGLSMWKEYKLNLAMGDPTFPYSDEVLELDLPVWARNEMEEVSR